MIRQGTGIFLTAIAAGALAVEPAGLLTGKDYYSLQIASSTQAGDLDNLFSKYADLPFLRIERRGEFLVLRAGFWETARDASTVRQDAAGPQLLLRLATFRPQDIVRQNWSGSKVAGEKHPADDEKNELSKRPEGVQNEAAPKAENTGIEATKPQPEHSVSSTTSHAVNSSEDEALRPFNAADYALAFEVFLGNGDQERAFRIARKAVASVPNDAGWRRKLARVAEWTHRPELAWEQWNFLFSKGDHSDETLSAVLRFAPSSGNSAAALEAWKIRGEHGVLTETQLDDVYNLFEEASLAQQGSQFFERQYRRNGNLRLLEYAAKLAANVGDDDRALQLYTERANLNPFSLDATLRAVVFLIRRDRLREAYALLEEKRAEVPADAVEYWHILSNISWELGETGTAEIALRRQSESAQSTDRLIFLVRQQHPEQAADLAFEAYRRFGTDDFLINALSIYGERGNAAAQTRIFKSLSEKDLQKAEKDNRFLILRAQYYQLKQDNEHAWVDFRRALGRSPDDSAVVAPVLWFLIDTRRDDELLPLLRRLTLKAENTSDYWQPFAAAYHALDRYREALYWYRKEIARNPDDILLLLNYADALDRVQLPGMGERVRRHAWLRLHEKFPKPELAMPLDSHPELLALARLAILNQPGDPGLALVRQVVEQLRGVGEGVGAGVGVTAESAQQTKDLIFGWAVSQEQFLSARAWMWLNYARHAKDRPPLWAESQTALQLNDTETMDRLLTGKSEGLPIYNRYDAAYALEHWPLALDTAFRGLENNGVDEELHDRYRQHAPQHSNYVQMSASSDKYGDFASHEQQLELKLVADRRLHLRFGWSQLSQSSENPTLAVPARQRLSSVEARWLGSQGETAFSLFRREELAGNTGWQFSQSWAWSPHLNLNGSIASHVDATDGLPLRVGGYENNLRLGLNYAISKREYVSIAPRLNRYYTQYGDYLGSGRIFYVDAGYRIRTEYPDWRVHAFAISQSYSYDGAVGAQALAHLSPAVRNAIASGDIDAVRYFVPDGSITRGVCLGMGENLAGQDLQEVYTRAWRHFYDVCPTRNTLNGAGYTGTIGIVGSISGEDHLSLRLEQSSDGSGSGALSRSLAARYKHYF